MEGIFSVLVVGGVASAAYLVFWWRFRERTRLWREAAQAAGLTDLDVPTFLGWETKLTGKAGALQVRLGTYQRGRHDNGTRVIIGGLRHGPYALTIRPEGVTSSIEKTFGERELEVGDPEFDSAAYMQGAPALVRAIFDSETRRLVQALLHGEWHVSGRAGERTLKVRASLSDDELRVDIPARVFDNTESWLPAALPALLGVGQRLGRPDDLAARIAANTRGEAMPAVRLANLQTLAAEFPNHAATREALRAALNDDSMAVCLQAAIALGHEGRERLLDLASQTAPDEMAARAITALGPDFPGERAIERLRQARDAGQAATALACIEAIGRAGPAQGVETLADVLASAPDDLAVAAARALGAAAGEAAERALVAALDHESADVRVAAAEGLGRVGSPLAVVPLRSASSAHAFDGALRRATRQAIVEIQSRVAGASPGQLSLAGDEIGHVSLVDEDRRGRVSLEQAEPGPDRSDS